MITQAEIIARAIRTINVEMNDWFDKCGGSENQTYKMATKELSEKREELCTMYRIQTGKSYE